jgi:hypothetical protein
VTNILQGLVTPPLVQNAGCGAYVFFAVFCLLAFIFTYFVVPETAGKSLEEMDRVFKDVSSEAVAVDICSSQRVIAQGSESKV